MTGEPTTTPPLQDDFIWHREDRVLAAMQGALEAAIETHGNNAKSIAWDVRVGFKQRLSGEPA
jgi:hypothetical protein